MTHPHILSHSFLSHFYVKWFLLISKHFSCVSSLNSWNIVSPYTSLYNSSATCGKYSSSGQFHQIHFTNFYIYLIKNSWSNFSWKSCVFDDGPFKYYLTQLFSKFKYSLKVLITLIEKYVKSHKWKEGVINMSWLI